MSRIIRTALAGAAIAAIAGGTAAPLAHAAPAPPDVPEAIVVAEGHQVFLVGHAVGVQIYRCDLPSGSWSLVAPRADLYGENGKLLGTHFGGPTWQARDGSYVVGRKVAEATVDPTAIDWLLVEARPSSADPDGGRLSATTFIQRVATTGGRAPAASQCDEADERVEVPYTADYVFWKAAVTGAAQP
jgi:hypothetical protein